MQGDETTKRWTVGFAALVLVGVGQVYGAVITFDFDSGTGPNFSVFNEGSLWTVDTDGPSLRIAKPADDGTYNRNNQIAGGVMSNFKIHGDFMVTVAFALHDFPNPEGSYTLNESPLAVIPESAFAHPLEVQSSFDLPFPKGPFHHQRLRNRQHLPENTYLS